LDVVNELAARDLVVAGLDVTFSGKPFEPTPSLIGPGRTGGQADRDLHGLRRGAIYHERLAPVAASGVDMVPEHVGGAEKYQARCRRHLDVR